jgi:carbon-monoxide dehydrogenase large subunit
MTTVEAREANPGAGSSDRPIGFGRMQRKEDPRFVRGKGNYLDDIVLPGMLHAAVLRAPVAHARLVSIDTTEALAHPKVLAVITGQDLVGLNLAWAPTLSADVQAVLVTDKVRFQGQEVAFVVAEDRYAARDALELIDVEYDLLPPVVDVRTGTGPRTRGRPRRARGTHRQPHLRLGGGRRRRDGRRLRPRRRRRLAGGRLPARAPRPDGDLRRRSRHGPGQRQADAVRDHAGAARAPHPVRAGRRHPEHKIRVISPDIGGGFGNKVGIYPGYILAVVGSIVTGRR